MNKLILLLLVVFNPFFNYILDTDDFTVVLPEEPKHMVQQIQINGETASLNLYVIEKEFLSYVLSYGNYPESVNLNDKEKLFKGVINGMVANYQGVLIDEKLKKTQSSVFGKSFIIKLPDHNYIHVDSYLKNRTLYQLIVKTESEKVQSEDVIQYFSSFRLK